MERPSKRNKPPKHLLVDNIKKKCLLRERRSSPGTQTDHQQSQVLPRAQEVGGPGRVTGPTTYSHRAVSTLRCGAIQGCPSGFLGPGLHLKHHCTSVPKAPPREKIVKFPSYHIGQLPLTHGIKLMSIFWILVKGKPMYQYC